MFLLALEVACDQTGSKAEAKSTKYQIAYVRRKFLQKARKSDGFLDFSRPVLPRRLPLLITRIWPERYTKIERRGSASGAANTTRVVAGLWHGLATGHGSMPAVPLLKHSLPSTRNALF